MLHVSCCTFVLLLSGFGREKKSLVTLKRFLDKIINSKERKDRGLAGLQPVLLAGELPDEVRIMQSVPLITNCMFAERSRQTSFEPGLSAFQSSAQKIEVSFFLDFLLSAVLRVRGRFQTPLRQIPVRTKTPVETFSEKSASSLFW